MNTVVYPSGAWQSGSYLFTHQLSSQDQILSLDTPDTDKSYTIILTTTNT